MSTSEEVSQASQVKGKYFEVQGICLKSNSFLLIKSLSETEK